MPNEQVLGVISGFYTAGTAILCVTSHRLLLVDKKLIRLSYEDVRFEAISEVNFSQQLFLASVKFYFSGRNVQFRSWYKKELRMLAQFAQNKMFESRHLAGALSGDFGALTPLVTQPQGQPTFPLQPKTNDNQQDLRGHSTGYQAYNRLARWQRAGKFIEDLSVVQSQGESS